jgi:hypothetical protein
MVQTFACRGEIQTKLVDTVVGDGHGGGGWRGVVDYHGRDFNNNWDGLCNADL